MYSRFRVRLLLTIAALCAIVLASCGGGSASSGGAAVGVVVTPTTAATAVVSLLAGNLGGPTFADGSSATARFDTPSGITIDGSGNLYVADSGNDIIRKITPAGVVSTFAGTLDTSGTQDGSGTAANFSNPQGLAVDKSGNIYVADSGGDTIRKITPTGTVTTLAGLAGAAGYLDTTPSEPIAEFDGPSGLAVDASGNVYVADTLNNVIREITTAGAVVTVAGTAPSSNSATNAGSADGAAASSSFKNPTGIAVDALGNIYVADTGNGTIRKISTLGTVSTIAGSAGLTGSSDGSGSAALFSNPSGITIDSSGNLDVTDGNTIRHIVTSSSPAVVTTVAGSRTASGSANGAGTVATFNGPRSIVADSAGNLYVTDTQNDAIRRINSALVVSTLAGSLPPFSESGQPGATDGARSAASFYLPVGLTVDASGNVYVADDFNAIIRSVSPTGVVKTIAGLADNQGIANGPGVAARFTSPVGVAADSAGNLYVADTYNCVIRKITPAGQVTTLAGSAGTIGSTDGQGSAARFDGPSGIAVDSNGTIYVSDSGNATIRKITPGGLVSTLAGSPGAGGSTDGQGAAATFTNPFGLAVDSSGNIYVADTYNDNIRKITPSGLVSTVAGVAQQAGSSDGLATSASGSGPLATFNHPNGAAVDSAGNIFVADTNNDTVREITTAGQVITVAGSAGVQGVVLGTGGTLSEPEGIAVDSADNLYVTSENSVVEINFATAPTVALTTSASSVYLGNSTTLNWWSSSNTTACTASGAWSGSEGATGTLNVQPSAIGTSTYTLSCTGPGGSSSQSVAVAVTAPPPVPAVTTFSATPSAITLGQSTTLSWTTANASSCTASGSWGGGEVTDGSYIATPATTGVQTYNLTCNGAGGASPTASTAVTVNAAASTTTSSTSTSTSTSSSGHGGAAGLDLLTALGLLGLLRRRLR